MRVAVSPTLRIAAGFLLAALAGAIGYHVLHQRKRGTPEALLERADEISWLNGWIAAAPLYHQAGGRRDRRAVFLIGVGDASVCGTGNFQPVPGFPYHGCPRNFHGTPTKLQPRVKG